MKVVYSCGHEDDLVVGKTKAWAEQKGACQACFLKRKRDTFLMRATLAAEWSTEKGLKPIKAITEEKRLWAELIRFEQLSQYFNENLKDIVDSEYWINTYKRNSNKPMFVNRDDM